MPAGIKFQCDKLRKRNESKWTASSDQRARQTHRIVNDCRETARETDHLNYAEGAAHVYHAAQRVGCVGFAKIHCIADTT